MCELIVHCVDIVHIVSCAILHGFCAWRPVLSAFFAADIIVWQFWPPPRGFDFARASWPWAFSALAVLLAVFLLDSGLVSLAV